MKIIGYLILFVSSFILFNALTIDAATSIHQIYKALCIGFSSLIAVASLFLIKD